jgi:NADPH:quinone reductase-like Zn-dependent oxidoreductase
MAEPSMDAVRLHGLGDTAKLAHERIATPRPGRGEVLVRIRAAAITRDELEWPEDRLPAIPSRLDPVDLVFDTAGGDRLEGSPAALVDGGRRVSVAAQPPDISDPRGITAVFFVVEPSSEQLGELARLADDGRLRVRIDRTYPLAEARTAFERSLADRGRGKIVLLVPGEPSP